MSSTLLTDLNQNDFCNETVLSDAAIQSIHGLCAKVIHHGSNSTREQIAQIYKAWKTDLNQLQENGPIRYYPHTPEQGTWKLAHSARDGLNAAVEKTKDPDRHGAAMLDHAQGGVDFPIWFSAKAGLGKARRVMIIAQDPLRKEEDFEQRGSPNGKRVPSFLIGTPFALHDKRFRRQGSGDSYWDIIDTLRHRNCHVYVTDLFKVYQRGADLSKGKIALPFFCDILYAEAKLFEPDVIVTFGRKACQALGSIKAGESFREQGVFIGKTPNHQLRQVQLCNHAGSTSEYPIVPLLHPSGSANGSRSRFRDRNVNFLKDCNGPMFAQLIFQALDMACMDRSNERQ